MLREYSRQVQEEDSRLARSSFPRQTSADYVVPDKFTADLPAPSAITWDSNARFGAKHMREIVAERAPTKALGARLWGRMMELPVGDDKLALHVRLLMKYKPWAYWTEAGFLFHPAVIARINKELDSYKLKDHLKGLLTN